MSFAVLFGSAAVFFGIWLWAGQQPTLDGTPRPFRQVLELNGKIWQAMFSPTHLNACKPPPRGKKPRVNGRVGLEGTFDPSTWTLTVIANEQDPNSRRLQLTIKDLQALPRTETSAEFRCIEGWSDAMSYAGVKFSDFMKAYDLSPHAYVGLVTPDEEYYVSLDIASMLHEQTLLAYEMNGEPLAPENGAPLRLIIPVKYGIKSLKRIGTLFFSDIRPPDYWAEQGYDWYAGL